MTPISAVSFKPIRLAAVGLPPPDKQSLESLCVLSARLDVPFEMAPDASSAQMWVVDGTHHRAPGWAATLPAHVRQRVVWIGKNPLNETAESIAKPVNWPLLLTHLEAVTRRLGIAPPLQVDVPISAPVAAPVAPPVSAPFAASVAASVATPVALPVAASPRVSPPLSAAVIAPPAVKPFNPSATQNLPIRPTVTSVSQPATAAGDNQVYRPSDVEEQDIAVLVVDDDSLARSHVANRLATLGIKPDLSNSARHALECSRKRAYDLFFLDVNMPVTDGYALCKAIKNNSLARPDAFVAMLTSRDGMVDKLRGTIAGCDAYLTKPSDQKKVATVVENVRNLRLVRLKEKAKRVAKA